MARKKKVRLPMQGDAFAVPFEGGLYGVYRVLADVNSERGKRWSDDCVLVACSEWFGTEVPTTVDPALRGILRLTYQSPTGRRALFWVWNSVPEDFIPIGRIQPTPDEITLDAQGISGWELLATHCRLQWQWDNDRTALDNERQTSCDDEKKQESKRRAFLADVTLKDLQNHEFFPRWNGKAQTKAIRESRKLMAATVRRLIDLGESASEKDRKAILQSCIESFNELDSKLEFIETVERKDICVEFEALVHACGLGKFENMADEWREW